MSDWLQKVKTAASVFRGINDYFASPPDDVSAAELLEGLRVLNYQFSGLTPHIDTSNQLASVWGRYAEDTIRDATLPMFQATYRAIGHRLDAGDVCRDLIRTADFGIGIRVIDSGARSSMGGGELCYAVGLISYLPTDHYLRSLMPESETYAHDGMSALVLGFTLQGTSKARDWYETHSAIALTKSLRFRQVEREKAKLDEDKREHERRRRQFYESEIGKAILRQREIERLQESDAIPDYIEPLPTIRQGGPTH